MSSGFSIQRWTKCYRSNWSNQQMQHERQSPNPSRIQIAKHKIGGLPTNCLQGPTLSSEIEREREREIRSLITQVFMVISCSKSRFQQSGSIVISSCLYSIFDIWRKYYDPTLLSSLLGSTSPSRLWKRTEDIDSSKKRRGPAEACCTFPTTWHPSIFNLF
jgi:hypothetical protein